MSVNSKKIIDMVIFLIFTLITPFVIILFVENLMAQIVSLILVATFGTIAKFYSHKTLTWLSYFIYRKMPNAIFFICFYLLAIAPTILKYFYAENMGWTILDILAESFLTNITATTLCIFISKYINTILSESQFTEITLWEKLNEALSGFMGLIIPFGTYIFIRLRGGFMENESRVDLIVNWFFLIVIFSFLAIFISIRYDTI